MSLAYLPDQVQEVRIALDLAERAVSHLRYSYQTLYEHSIDQAWVEQLASREDLAEKLMRLLVALGGFRIISEKNCCRRPADCWADSLNRCWMC